MSLFGNNKLNLNGVIRTFNNAKRTYPHLTIIEVLCGDRLGYISYDANINKWVEVETSPMNIKFELYNEYISGKPMILEKHEDKVLTPYIRIPENCK